MHFEDLVEANIQLAGADANGGGQKALVQPPDALKLDDLDQGVGRALVVRRLWQGRAKGADKRGSAVERPQQLNTSRIPVSGPVVAF